MSAPDKLVPIPCEHWPELRDLYRAEWPKHEVAFNTIQNYINWVKIDPRIRNLEVVSLNGSWRQNGTYLVLDRNQVFPYTLEESCDSLRRAFQLLDWDYSHLVCSLRECHRLALDDVQKPMQLEGKLEHFWYHPAHLFYLSREECLRFEVGFPAGFRLAKLGIEHGLYANRIWPHRSEASEYFFKRLAAWNVSIGLFNESDELLAWCFQWPTGAIGPLEVHPDHYRKGYGTIIAKAIAKEVAAAGFNCYGTVRVENEASGAMFTKLGFRPVDCHNFVRNKARKLCEWAD
ncbi:hypothetical protein quinque_010577 [Culex quinquefasciatus]